MSKSELAWAAKRQLPAGKKQQQQKQQTIDESTLKQWPPDKFNKTPSSGYGTSWVPPKTVKRNLTDESTIRRASSLNRNRSITPAGRLNQSYESNRSLNASVTDLQGLFLYIIMIS